MSLCFVDVALAVVNVVADAVTDVVVDVVAVDGLDNNNI